MGLVAPPKAAPPFSSPSLPPIRHITEEELGKES